MVDNGSPSCRRGKSGEGEKSGKGNKKCGEGRRGEGRRVIRDGETGVGSAGFRKVEKPALVTPVLSFYKLVKPSLVVPVLRF